MSQSLKTISSYQFTFQNGEIKSRTLEIITLPSEMVLKYNPKPKEVYRWQISAQWNPHFNVYLLKHGIGGLHSTGK